MRITEIILLLKFKTLEEGKLGTLFSDENVKYIMKGLPVEINGSGLDSKIKDVFVTLVNMINDSPELWDDRCSYNIGLIGEKTKESILGLKSSSSKSKNEYYFDILSSFFRFFMEFNFSSDKYKSFSDDIKLKMKNISTAIGGDFKLQVDYAIYEMPIDIIKKFLGSQVIENIKYIDSLYEKKRIIEEDWEAKINEESRRWKEEIDSRQAKVDKIKESLDQQEKEFNFVGLHEGFDQLHVDKKNELSSIVWWMRLSIASIFSPMLFELYFLYSHSENILNYQNLILFSLLPVFSLIVISTYFFRVLLSNYKNIKSQIMEIELRKTLCRFIQSYADYSADLKSKNNVTLQKFEEIIFSNLLSKDSGVLSAFDGMEKFSGIINATKKA